MDKKWTSRNEIKDLKEVPNDSDDVKDNPFNDGFEKAFLVMYLLLLTGKI